MRVLNSAELSLLPGELSHRGFSLFWMRVKNAYIEFQKSSLTEESLTEDELERISKEHAIAVYNRLRFEYLESIDSWTKNDYDCVKHRLSLNQSSYVESCNLIDKYRDNKIKRIYKSDKLYFVRKRKCS